MNVHSSASRRKTRRDRPNRKDDRQASRAGVPDRGGPDHNDPDRNVPDRPGPDQADKRRRLLDAALRTFAERGYHGTTVPEVARAARVATGTIYLYFTNKETLVNEVFRDAKLRLRGALVDHMMSLDDYSFDLGERWFRELWRRLAEFARAEPDAFRFLEMQDHAPYLDAESRQIEMSVLAPLWQAGTRLHGRTNSAPVEVMIALAWGAFVGLVKASRLGYLQLDDDKLEQAGAACWRMVAPQPSRAADADADAKPTTTTRKG